MKVDRKIIPAISGIAELNIERPEKFIMPNGMVMNVINTGKEDVIRLDLVMRCGQLNQRFPLQAMKKQRMLLTGKQAAILIYPIKSRRLQVNLQMLITQLNHRRRKRKTLFSR